VLSLIPLNGGARSRCVRGNGILLCLLVSSATLPASAQSVDSLFVRTVSFEGNESIDDLTLRLSIATTQASAFARRWPLRYLGLGTKRAFDPRELRRDVLRVKAFYGASGFPMATVDTTLERAGDDVLVRFLIEEGQPVLVKSLLVNGGEFLPQERVWRRTLPLRVGEPFNKLLLQPTVDLVRGLARDGGYPFANAAASFQEDSAGHADIVLTVLPGNLTYIDSVLVEGAAKVDPEIIRRIVTVRPGQRYSAARIYDSQLALHRLGVFRSVQMGLVDSVPDAVRDSSTVVFVRLQEASFQSLRLGVGYGTLDCMRTLATWEVFDFLGGGRTFQVSTRLSQLGTGTPFDLGFQQSICPALRDEDPARLKANYHISASLTDPYFFFHRANATVSLFAERATEFQAFLRESVGGELATGGRIRGLPISLSYSLSRGRTEADAVTFCSFLNVCRFADTQVFSTWRTRAALGLELTRNTTDAVLNAGRGLRTSLGIRWASPTIGSDTLIHFARAELEVAGYGGVGRSTLAGRFMFGIVVSPEIGLPSGPGRFVPPGERFYSGGPNTVRGFTQNQLGPLVRVLRDVVTTDDGADSTIQTSSVGGDILTVANLELRIPLSDRGPVSIALFVDAGRLDSRTGNFASGLVVTPGIGTRVRSPIGPIRFDIGYNPAATPVSPLYAQQGNELVLLDPEFQPDRTFFNRLRFHFAVGQAF